MVPCVKNICIYLKVILRTSRDVLRENIGDLPTLQLRKSPGKMKSSRQFVNKIVGKY